MTEKPSQDLVVGASSAIAGALIERWSKEAFRPITAVSRSLADVHSLSALKGVNAYQSDYSDESLQSMTTELLDGGIDINRLIVCNGVLQGEGYRPERALNQLEVSAMRDVFEANTFTPMRVLAALWCVRRASSLKLVCTAPRCPIQTTMETSPSE